ncbi:MAG: AAA family ATPase [Sphaerochaeta sp.]|jgi:DNA repair exonuclease SbcCD ATPase subunit|nr:AAA family ATPase [Sphaerochaeta sp.]
MKLQTLTLKNFKGLSDLTLPMDGQNIAVYGDNGTGKTTVADAFYFLLFGKDSLNRKDFEVLPLDENGQRRTDITQAEVEGMFDLDGKQISLKRVYAEKWTKKRGTAQRELTGHTTDYYIDGVPTKQKDYDAVIAKLTDSDEAFKLLTNPRYFCEVLPWQSRRNLLLKVCGDLTDAEVIANDKKLADLPAILDGLTMDDRRKVIKSKLTEINAELTRIPVRIDEVQRGLPDESAENFTEALSELKAQRKTKLEQKTRIQAGGQIAELIKIQREIEAEIQRMKNEASGGQDTEKRKYQQNIAELQMHITSLKNQIKGNNDLAKRNGSLKDSLDGTLESLREEWATLNKQEYTGTDTCPTCGQALPADQIDAARAKFNVDKSKRLERIQADGKIQRKKYDDLKSENDRLADKNAEIEQSIAATETAIKEQEDCIRALDTSTTPVPSPDIEKKLQELQANKEAIAKLKEDTSGALNAVQAEINNIDNQIADVERIIAQAKQREDGLKRIAELKAQQKKLAKEYEELERQLYLTDQFVQTKVSLLEEKINSRFQIARFKLFNQLINGGIEECCECTVNGIPYDAGLNNGARINAGLDIINTLSTHFGMHCPIWIDNRESVTCIPEMDYQVISLFVSETDKTLRIETVNEKVGAA